MLGLCFDKLLPLPAGEHALGSQCYEEVGHSWSQPRHNFHLFGVKLAKKNKSTEPINLQAVYLEIYSYAYIQLSLGIILYAAYCRNIDQYNRKRQCLNGLTSTEACESFQFSQGQLRLLNLAADNRFRSNKLCVCQNFSCSIDWLEHIFTENDQEKANCTSVLEASGNYTSADFPLAKAIQMANFYISETGRCDSNTVVDPGQLAKNLNI